MENNNVEINNEEVKPSFIENNVNKKDTMFNDFSKFELEKENYKRKKSQSEIDGSYQDVGSGFDESEPQPQLTTAYDEEPVHDEEFLETNLDALEINEQEITLEDPIYSHQGVDVEEIEIFSDGSAQTYDNAISEIQEATNKITEESNIEQVTEQVESIGVNDNDPELTPEEADAKMKEDVNALSDVIGQLDSQHIETSINEGLNSSNIVEQMQTTCEQGGNIFSQYKVKDINKGLNEMGVEQDTFSKFYNNNKDNAEKLEETMKNILSKIKDPNNNIEVQNAFSEPQMKYELDKVVNPEKDQTLDQSIGEAAQAPQMSQLTNAGKNIASQVFNAAINGQDGTEIR